MKCVYVCVGGLLLGSRRNRLFVLSLLVGVLVKEFGDTGSKPNQSFLFSQMFNSFLYIISKEF